MEMFAGLKNVFNFFKTEPSAIDNGVFRLHYRATVAILVIFSILVTCRQYFGDPIDCISKDDIPSDLLDTYCWIHTTFSASEAWKKKVGVEVPYPGVDKYTPGENRVYHAYYQWVCFVLFLQAILFYTPRYFWKTMEGGKVKNLTLGLNSPILTEDIRNKNRGLLVGYMASNLNKNNLYFMNFALAEIMNFVNVVGQIFLTDVFLRGEFLTYGSNVVQFSSWDWSIKYDPMVKVFPRVTKCTFYRFGSSGDVQRHDAICILPINILNEKIYLFLWFWFVILAVLSGLILVYRSVVVLCPKSRSLIISHRVGVVSHNDLQVILTKCHLSDWLLLNFLCKNIDPLNFKDFITDLTRSIERKKTLDSI